MIMPSCHAHSQFGRTQQLSRSMIYLTQKGESALNLLHKSQQQLGDPLAK
jgi:hypothetical protein